MGESRRLRVSALMLCVLLVVFVARFYSSGSLSGATASGHVSWFASEEQRQLAARRQRMEQWRLENAAWIVAKQELRRRLGRDVRVDGWNLNSTSSPACVESIDRNLYRVRGWVEPANQRQSGSFTLELRYVGEGDWQCERYVVNWDY